MTDERERAKQAENIARFMVDRFNVGDLDKRGGTLRAGRGDRLARWWRGGGTSGVESFGVHVGVSRASRWIITRGSLVKAVGSVW
ncbi:hypothetical protein GCM10022267_31210 [Lentzea roselyniae]|uniref:Uncharacterized protein n=1 Tax=Lentzea roselyniae TaxID=531940 RepID=A0ABP7AXS1_9PSEU